MKMTNRWNRFIYRLWPPVYDMTVGHFFLPGRVRALIFRCCLRAFRQWA